MKIRFNRMPRRKSVWSFRWSPSGFDKLYIACLGLGVGFAGSKKGSHILVLQAGTYCVSFSTYAKPLAADAVKLRIPPIPNCSIQPYVDELPTVKDTDSIILPLKQLTCAELKVWLEAFMASVLVYNTDEEIQTFFSSAMVRRINTEFIEIIHEIENEQ